MWGDDAIHEFPVSLRYTHLSQAIDLYLIAEGSSPILSWEKESYNPDWIIRKNMSISSIIHSFCAVESAVNTIAYGVFREERHPNYIAPMDRDFLLKRSISHWKTMQCIDKFCLLIECTKQAEPPQSVLTDLRELNNLRNWIVHGFVYKSTVLLEKNSEGNYDQIDVENEIDWLKHFPSNAFNPLDRMNHQDARKALIVALRALAWVQPADHSAGLIVTSHIKPIHVTIIPDANFDFFAMLDSYIAKGGTKE